MLIIRLVDRNIRILSGLGSGLAIVLEIVVPQPEAAYRIGPGRDRGYFRRAVGIGRGILCRG